MNSLKKVFRKLLERNDEKKRLIYGIETQEDSNLDGSRAICLECNKWFIYYPDGCKNDAFQCVDCGLYNGTFPMSCNFCYNRYYCLCHVESKKKKNK